MAVMAQDRGMTVAQGTGVASGAVHEVGATGGGVPVLGTVPGAAAVLAADRRAPRPGRSRIRRVLGRAATWRRACAAVVDRWTGRQLAPVVRVCRADGERGMATAEYAIVMIAAGGFAALLIAILSSSEIREVLTGLVRGALSV